LSRKTVVRQALAAALDLARLACGDWDRDRFWNWKGSAAAAAFDVVLDGELMLVVADAGVVKEEDGNVFESGVALSGLSGVQGGGMRFAFRDVRSGEGVCGR
jgi:hypothetical protein